MAPESGALTDAPAKVEYMHTASSVSKPFHDILPVDLHNPNRDYHGTSTFADVQCAKKSKKSIFWKGPRQYPGKVTSRYERLETGSS
ncbi:hypothetical protein HYPSUDRAFT_200930 [Hypholoma sublateritium FD-334 SS-4]|uniref:Uncharacterized protein n=1 Tax=Hypholoma sublateritium (strain FD-334 SS-4) TaxID=945553 RepID=A0A0D2LA71_HYPSF|nr:hypothetical protein HYPSUDRAFT_200930 [Hypholoma sublateritium FD-334 SS-4]